MEPYEWFGLFMDQTIPGTMTSKREFVSWIYTQRSAAEGIQVAMNLSTAPGFPLGAPGVRPGGVVTEQNGSPIAFRTARAA